MAVELADHNLLFIGEIFLVKQRKANGIIYLPDRSDLPNRRLAFRLEIRLADVLDIISLDLVFVI